MNLLSDGVNIQKMIYKILVVFVAVIAIFISATTLSCDDFYKKDGYVRGRGTIIHIDSVSSGSGIYVIVASNNEQYQPINLLYYFQIDSLKVFFSGTIREDISFVEQWGIALELDSISRQDSTYR